MRSLKLSRSCTLLVLLTAGWFYSPIGLARDQSFDEPAKALRVMTWNIWHGGREDGEQVGPQRVIDVIKQSGADIVAMQETYGSGEIISKGLGFNYQPRGTNLSIHSRYKILEDISVFEEFKCTGSLIELPNKHKLAFYCIWLPYGDDIWLPGVRENTSLEKMQAACKPSADDLQKIVTQIKKRLSDPKYDKASIMIAGDFNSMSHLDYGTTSVDQYSNLIDWKTSRVMTAENFRDSYRETNPTIDRTVDSTWSPRFPDQEQDRIDFIYYKSKQFRASKSKVIQTHPTKFPSDHAAVLTEFTWQADLISRESAPVRTVSYNIKRGYGNDDKTDLSRATNVLKRLNPDVVGLQEIDFNARRSGNVNQAAVMGKELGMHAAFGPFMDFQGGQYGMAVLTRYPIRSVELVKLPKGNEPRIALAVEVLLPNDQRMMIVNVHFDWVRDDTFRFAQASELKKYLNKLEMPYILLGDFNDRLGSRTLNLLSDGMVEADKPESDHFTIPSDNPRSEIDFIFVAPEQRWTVKTTRVIDEPVASDHRPVFSELSLRGSTQEQPK